LFTGTGTGTGTRTTHKKDTTPKINTRMEKEHTPIQNVNEPIHKKKG
jgi:hypothetical protein